MTTPRLILTRFGSTPFGTFGRLALTNARSLATVELPWRHNTPRISCVPAGIYHCTTVPSERMSKITAGKRRRAWCLINVPGRVAILIHPGNTVLDTQGCIIVGCEHATINCCPGVKNSRVAYAVFESALEGINAFELEIKWALSPETGPQP